MNLQNQLKSALFDGEAGEKAKAIQWLRQMKRATIRDRTAFKVEDGKLYHGVKSDVDATMKNAAIRRDMNRTQTFGEIAPLASFDKAAIRSYARSRGIPAAEMYRNPAHLKAMLKDHDYAKFRLQDNAHKMV
jgi:hypothetical protein